MKSAFTSLRDLASLRDLSTLRDLCYFALPEEQHALLKELCLPIPDWDYYYNIVNRDFPISREYFMLPLTQGRKCCQLSRFVEVYSKFKLIPESVHPKFGVYEPFAALEEAVLRNDVQMALYYFSLLSPSQKPRIRNFYWKAKKIFGKDTKFRMAALEAVWSLYFDSLEGFPDLVEEWQRHTDQVCRGLTKLDLSVYDNEKKKCKALRYLVSQGNQEAFSTLFDEDDCPVMSHTFLPSILASGNKGRVEVYSAVTNRRGRITERECGDWVDQGVNIAKKETSDCKYYSPLLASVIKGGNPSLFIEYAEAPFGGPVSFHQDLLQGMRERNNPLGFYRIMELVQGEREAKVLYPDMDINLLYIQRHRVSAVLIRDTILANPGHLPFIKHIKQAYPKANSLWKELSAHLDGEVYPLSVKLLAE
ncbi:Hypothetical protein BRZCDTV_9 [Brazilian cedratvirus IHUMI]|uniref:Uncharacterized protein n=1 Tax=Brazilian cedratvirus IHUMI TaxID=2126980 RepID=A0A2R8FCR6_9VIRU|nr:Hypothetical protein BRZCDTV_9 [Brazilian cedratvirus IHUMI]